MLTDHPSATATSQQLSGNVQNCPQVPLAPTVSTLTPSLDPLTDALSLPDGVPPLSPSLAPTHPSKKPRTLSTLQLRALPFLAQGLPDAEVARRVDVHPRTINRWRLFDPLFASRLNRIRHAVWANTLDHLRSLLPDALAVLATALRGGDERTRLRAAFLLLKVSGTSRLASRVGPDNTTDILLERIAAHRRRRYSPAELQQLDPPSDTELDDFESFLLRHIATEDLTDIPLASTSPDAVPNPLPQTPAIPSPPTPSPTQPSASQPASAAPPALQTLSPQPFPSLLPPTSG